jgi:ureidoglycolate amidohydrolase
MAAALFPFAILLVSVSVAGRSLIDGQRVVDQLTKLARFSDHPNPAVTRILFTENDLRARG